METEALDFAVVASLLLGGTRAVQHFAHLYSEHRKPLPHHEVLRLEGPAGPVAGTRTDRADACLLSSRYLRHLIEHGNISCL